VVIDAPLTWCDITDEVDAAEPPFTSKDVGALQFSVARYESGPVADPSPDDLLAMAEELGADHGLTDPHEWGERRGDYERPDMRIPFHRSQGARVAERA
jgi:hypothetical protein